MMMLYSMIFSAILLATTKAFVKTALPMPLSMRGVTQDASVRFVCTWFRPQLNQQPNSSHHQKIVLEMNFVSDIYDLRSNSLGFASKDDVKAAASNPKAVFLDVRNPAEIASASFDTDKSVLYATCTSMEDCPALKQLPKDKDAPVIVFCASGKRAASAKQVFEEAGYTNVLNAGGLGDLDYL